MISPYILPHPDPLPEANHSPFQYSGWERERIFLFLYRKTACLLIIQLSRALVSVGHDKLMTTKC